MYNVGAAAAAGAPLGPMGMLGGAALSFLPGLLGGLFGGESPQEKFRKQMTQLLSPQNVGAQTQQLYQQHLQSPAYAGALRQNAAGGNALQTNLARSLGARGLGTSGIGSIAPGLAQTAAGGMNANTRTQAYDQSAQQAMQLIMQQLGMQQQVGQQQPGMGGQMLGAGMSNFAPLLMQFLNQQGGGNGMGAYGGVGAPNQAPFWGPPKP